MGKKEAKQKAATETAEHVKVAEEAVKIAQEAAKASDAAETAEEAAAQAIVAAEAAEVALSAKDNANTALQASRERTIQELKDSLQGEREAAQDAKKDLKEIHAEAETLIGGLRRQIAENKKTIKALNKTLAAVVPKKHLQDPKATRKKFNMDREFQIKDHDIRIHQHNPTGQFPGSKYPVAYLEAKDMEKGITLDDLKDHILEAHGEGKYTLTSFLPQAAGHASKIAQKEISVES